MLSTYRAILSRPGALAFSSAGVVARLPLSMVGLGIVLLVSSLTGSYGLAGSVTAAYLVANAVFSVVQGRLLDRLGQGRVLVVATWVFALSLTLTAMSVQNEWPRGLTYLAAALSGASLPAVGACVRARWSHVLDSPAQVQTAFALESVLDEVVFMTGPILVTVLATTVAPGGRPRRGRGGRPGRHTRPGRPAGHRAPRPAARRGRRRAPADAVAAGRDDRGRVRGAGCTVRRCRGGYRRLHRGARTQALGRRAAGAVGRRQSDRRAGDRRDPLAARAGRAAAARGAPGWRWRWLRCR